MNCSSTLPARLELLIETANSQKEVARLANVSDGTLINWLRGHGVRPSKLRQVARNLGVSLAWLRDGVGNQAAELAAFRARLSHPQMALRRDHPLVQMEVLEVAEPSPAPYTTVPHLLLPDGAPGRYVAPFSRTEVDAWMRLLRSFEANARSASTKPPEGPLVTKTSSATGAD